MFVIFLLDCCHIWALHQFEKKMECMKFELELKIGIAEMKFK